MNKPIYYSSTRRLTRQEVTFLAEQMKRVCVRHTANRVCMVVVVAVEPFATSGTSRLVAAAHVHSGTHVVFCVGLLRCDDAHMVTASVLCIEGDCDTMKSCRLLMVCIAAVGVIIICTVYSMSGSCSSLGCAWWRAAAGDWRRRGVRDAWTKILAVDDMRANHMHASDGSTSWYVA